MKEAMFYEKIENKKVRCHLCGWNSILPFGCIIEKDKTGICRVRKNIDGTLYSLIYDKISSMVVHEIERKPLYHFAPGTKAFSICTQGCNWRCKYCQNWALSQGEIYGEGITPKEIVKRAKESGSKGISYTFTEPIIFYELTYETSKIAKKEGLYTTYVTNGFISPEPIREISPYLDAVVVNFKGSGNLDFMKRYVGVPSIEPIYNALLEFKRNNIHIEITDLILPEVGDSKEDIRKLTIWIRDNLSPETPLHFLRFYPDYKVLDLPFTPIETLNEAYKIAKDEGMRYVYLGNVDDSRLNTYCPECGTLLIERKWMKLISIKLKDSRCPICGTSINIKGIEYANY
ncbi:MAG: AmmeMemoRadiSam system radical SAM enzyme [candidate division WOR-3 bacterium]